MTGEGVMENAPLAFSDRLAAVLEHHTEHLRGRIFPHQRRQAIHISSVECIDESLDDRGRGSRIWRSQRGRLALNLAELRPAAMERGFHGANRAVKRGRSLLEAEIEHVLEQQSSAFHRRQMRE